MPSQPQYAADPIDGFLYSTTLRLLPTQFRANTLAQMEVLRRARGYKCRMFVAPDTLVNPIPAFSQIETQIRMAPGTYVWGISCYVSTASKVKIQITDKCTEIPLFSDYVKAALFVQNTTGRASTLRAPTLLQQPRLIDAPGQVNVEIYNDNTEAVTAQLVLYCAEPVVPDPDIKEGNHIR